MSAETLQVSATDRVRYEVRRARKTYRCDRLECCRNIEVGRQYLHLTAMPGHLLAPAWDVLRECVDCASKLGRPLLHHFTDYP